ncbi:MAG: hypothetical protein K0A99_00020 [Desulfoarculaceae bacterium]|nr:hypothetical protein [Desulfoarculaceae bacterium]
MTSEVIMQTLSLRNMLWSTRGKEWGFRFVHLPAFHPGQWEAIYQKIFGRDDRVPQRWYGLVSLSDGAEIKYVASRFFDPDATWKDGAGREIPHEILLDVGSIPIEEVVGRAWEYTVMNQVRDFYRDIYSKDSNEIQVFQATMDNVLLPLTTNSFEVKRQDIQLAEHGEYAKKPWINESLSYENVWRILNKDVTEFKFVRKIIGRHDNVLGNK